MKRIVVKHNRYVDSVTLMGVSERARKTEGLTGAEAGMGTPANRELLENYGYTLPERVGPNDLMLAAEGSEGAVTAALAAMEELLNRGRTGGTNHSSLDDGDLTPQKYPIVQISLPGEYAGEQAKKALEKGFHVFMFSDNVSLKEEVALKRYAVEHDLLMMGPDCGVAQIGGVCLGAGSIVAAGSVGIVGASGSGAQEVACLIEAMGGGISQLIGTGGRDLTPEVGGLVMRQGMKLLDEDGRTKVIVLVSKIASPAVMEEVLREADGLKKTVVAVFLGGNKALFEGHRTVGAFSLEEAACKAVVHAGGEAKQPGFSREELEKIALREVGLYRKGQKYLRGLYCGGTFAEEGLLYYAAHCKNVAMHSNLNTASAQKLSDKEVSVGHTVLDLGAEDFTAAAPHPVFEPALRLERLRRELEDEEVALVTLDFITGPGVHEDPVTPFLEEIGRAKARRHVTLIANVCGSRLDPQNTANLRRQLREAGVIVTKSNCETARLSALILNALQGEVK